MNQSMKLLWGEGLFLCPQHFQRQDAYHESNLRETSRALSPYGWGVRHVQFDVNSLASGVLRPVELSVIFPDGELYQAPTTDELPAPITLDDLPAGTQEVVIHLALPLFREHGTNCSREDDDNATRYVQEDISATDAYSDADDANITLLRKSVRLLTGDQSRDAFVTVPLVKLKRSGNGTFDLDSHFLPPSLNLQASPELSNQLRSLLDAMQAKAESLYEMHREPTKNIIEFRSGDAASFWLLHTLNGGFSGLLHLLQHPDLPLERLHQELSRIAGSLLTFSTEYRLSDLPNYDHLQPADGFQLLFDMIRSLVGTVISSNYTAIPLTEVKPSWHQGNLKAANLKPGCRFYLGISGDVSAAELVEIVPSQFKVGAPEDVDKIVLSALAGIPLVHQSQVPSAIPLKPGTTYFAIEARGTLYERMIKAGAITIYTPTSVPDLSIELMAIDPS